jgi:hypothetical protein
MLKILPAESEMEYQQVRELLVEHIAWDTSQVSQLGLDGQEALDFYYASGDVALPGAYAPPEGRRTGLHQPVRKTTRGHWCSPQAFSVCGGRSKGLASSAEETDHTSQLPARRGRFTGEFRQRRHCDPQLARACQPRHDQYLRASEPRREACRT